MSLSVPLKLHLLDVDVALRARNGVLDVAGGRGGVRGAGEDRGAREGDRGQARDVPHRAGGAGQDEHHTMLAEAPA